jgi:hypothetical protein
MIAFGCSITAPDVYESAAGPGIELAKEPDSVVYANAAAGSIFRSYNLLMDMAAKHEDLEALVLVHQDAEITDPDFCAKVRRGLSDPDVGVVGCVGAIGVRTIAWWEGSVTWASFVHKYGELGGGELPAFAWGDALPPYARTGEVDTVDGFVLCLSPWVVRNLRFDESLGALHGYDFDFCLTVREAGKKVVTEDLKVIHHHSLDLVSNPDTWIDAHIAVTEKWEGRMPGIGQGGGDWKARALRAEAEAAVSRAQAVSAQMKAEAVAAQLRRDFDETVESISWRITAPLRKLNLARRTLLDRRRNGGATSRLAQRLPDRD